VKVLVVWSLMSSQKQGVLPEAGKPAELQSRAGQRFMRCMTNTLPATCDRITYPTYPALYINEARSSRGTSGSKTYRDRRIERIHHQTPPGIDTSETSGSIYLPLPSSLRDTQHTMAESTPQTSINIPQILAVALVGFFAIRWFLNKPASPSTPGSSASSTQRGQQPDLTKINQLATMFPQLDRRTIAWDLHRNGGSVPATTERVLSGRGLDAPPVTWQPNIAAPVQQAPATGTSSGSARKDGSGKREDDLITRYNLQGRVGGKGKEAVPSEEEQRKSAWSSDKAVRAEVLRKRREEMVLAARRKLEAKGA